MSTPPPPPRTKMLLRRVGQQGTDQPPRSATASSTGLTPAVFFAKDQDGQQRDMRDFLREQMRTASAAHGDAHDDGNALLSHRVIVPHRGPTVLDVTDDDCEYLSLAAAVDRGLEREDAVTATRKRKAEAVQQRPSKRARYQPECFMCAYGNTEYDGDPDLGCQPFVELVNIFRSCYGTMSNEELAIKLSNYYYAHIYEPAEALAQAAGEAGPDLPEMPPEKFKTHMTMHTLNPVIMVGEALRYVRDAIVLNRTEHVDNERAVDKFAKLGGLLKGLLTIPRETYFGAHMHGEQLAIDPATVGEPTNLRRVRPLLRKTQTTLGGETATDNSQVATQRRRIFDMAATPQAPATPEAAPVFDSAERHDDDDNDVDDLFA